MQSQEFHLRERAHTTSRAAQSSLGPGLVVQEETRVLPVHLARRAPDATTSQQQEQEQAPAASASHFKSTYQVCWACAWQYHSAWACMSALCSDEC